MRPREDGGESLPSPGGIYHCGRRERQHSDQRRHRQPKLLPAPMAEPSPRFSDPAILTLPEHLIRCNAKICRLPGKPPLSRPSPGWPTHTADRAVRWPVPGSARQFPYPQNPFIALHPLPAVAAQPLHFRPAAKEGIVVLRPLKTNSTNLEVIRSKIQKRGINPGCVKEAINSTRANESGSFLQPTCSPARPQATDREKSLNAVSGCGCPPPAKQVRQLSSFSRNFRLVAAEMHADRRTAPPLGNGRLLCA
jgi:hypothetical protein